jgi:hypothetical protein
MIDRFRFLRSLESHCHANFVSFARAKDIDLEFLLNVTELICTQFVVSPAQLDNAHSAISSRPIVLLQSVRSSAQSAAVSGPPMRVFKKNR